MEMKENEDEKMISIKGKKKLASYKIILVLLVKN